MRIGGKVDSLLRVIWLCCSLILLASLVASLYLVSKIAVHLAILSDEAIFLIFLIATVSTGFLAVLITFVLALRQVQRTLDEIKRKVDNALGTRD